MASKFGNAPKSCSLKGAALTIIRSPDTSGLVSAWTYASAMSRTSTHATLEECDSLVDVMRTHAEEWCTYPRTASIALSIVPLTTASYHHRIDSFSFSGFSTSCSTGPNTYGGFSETMSQLTSLLCRFQNSHTVRSPSVLLAQYFPSGDAPAPFSCISAIAPSFQSASETVCSSAEGVIIAATEEVTMKRFKTVPCFSADVRMVVVPWTAGLTSSAGSSAV